MVWCLSALRADELNMKAAHTLQWSSHGNIPLRRRRYVSERRWPVGARGKDYSGNHWKEWENSFTYRHASNSTNKQLLRLAQANQTTEHWKAFLAYNPKNMPWTWVRHDGCPHRRAASYCIIGCCTSAKDDCKATCSLTNRLIWGQWNSSCSADCKMAPIGFCYDLTNAKGSTHWHIPMRRVVKAHLEKAWQF